MRIQFLRKISMILLCFGLMQPVQANKRISKLTPDDVTIPAKVEAENFVSSQGVSTEATSDVGGGLNVGWIDAGDYMNYAISVPVSGNYTVDFRISSTFNNNTFQLASGSTVLTTVNVPNTGGWQNWQTVTKTISLTAGSQTIQLYSTTGGLNINWLEFKSTIVGTPIPAKIEAENYSLANGIDTQTTTDTGGGLNVGWTDPGDIINYSIYVPTAGQYTVDYRISTVVSTAYFQLRSGSTVLTSVNLPLTSGWQAWQTVSSTVSLSAGSQTIQLYVTAAGFNINWLEFKNPPVSDTTPPAAITSLVASTPTSSSIKLNWTAPGDDNNTGTASSYSIRYSTSAITSANFSSAAVVSSAPAPTVAGTAQTVTVTSLSASTTYYFALKTSDEVPNVSALSNVVSVSTTTVITPPPSTIPVDQFLGVNGFIVTPIDKMQAFGIVREYHNWSWDEGDIWNDKGVWKGDTTYSHYYPNSQMKWEPSWAGNDDPTKKWRFDTFYTNVKNAGVLISPDIKDSPPWLHGGKTYQSYAKPTDEAGASTTNPNSYEKKAHEMFEFAARYGSTAVADNLLTLAPGQPRNSGMNLVKYVEDWNEQDANWWGDGGIGYFSPQEYAAMASADYDGHVNTMHQGAGTFGVKNADPNIKLVMGGIFQLNLDYIQQMKTWFEANRSDHKFAVDVINLHHYAWLYGDPMYGGPAKSPEQDDLKGKMQVFTDYRNQNLPGKEVWLSEFGYDTNPASPLSPPQIGSFDAQEVQGQWIVRSFLALAAAGVDRAMVYTMADGGTSPTQFETSGLLLQDNTPKKSWYYVYTLKNVLTNMVFIGEQTASDPNILIYKFKNLTTNKGVYAVWSKTAADYKVSGFNLPLATTASSAMLTTFAPGDTDGVTSALTISSGKVSINVSESPIFITVNDITGNAAGRLSQEEITTALEPEKDNGVSVYPNPANHFLYIKSVNAAHIQLYDINGNLQLQRQAEAGETQVDVSSLKRGMYIIRINDSKAYRYSKVVIE